MLIMVLLYVMWFGQKMHTAGCQAHQQAPGTRDGPSSDEERYFQNEQST